MSKIIQNRVLTYMKANNQNPDRAEHASSIMFEAPIPYVSYISDAVANRYLDGVLELREAGLVEEDESGRFFVKAGA
jgi:hypothetical protein